MPGTFQSKEQIISEDFIHEGKVYTVEIKIKFKQNAVGDWNAQIVSKRVFPKREE